MLDHDPFDQYSFRRAVDLSISLQNICGNTTENQVIHATKPRFPFFLSHLLVGEL